MTTFEMGSEQWAMRNEEFFYTRHGEEGLPDVAIFLWAKYST